MKRIKYFVVAATFSLLFTGCSNTKNIVPDAPPAELYKVAQKKLNEGDFRGAITQLEALDTRYPFGPYAQQTQLDLIYAYYKASEFSLAQASIDRFIRLNPTHPNLDYVIYMRGLTDVAMNENWLQNLFNIDSATRDPQYAMIAFNDFSQLIKHYPNSPYATDARKHLIFLKNQLAKHELAVAKYYTERGAYTAVVNRVQEMLQKFPDTQATREALPLMEQAYKKLKLNQQAEKVAQLIAANPAN